MFSTLERRSTVRSDELKDNGFMLKVLAVVLCVTLVLCTYLFTSSTKPVPEQPPSKAVRLSIPSPVMASLQREIGISSGEASRTEPDAFPTELEVSVKEPEAFSEFSKEPKGSPDSEDSNDEDGKKWTPSTKDMILNGLAKFHPANIARAVPKFIAGLFGWMKQPTWKRLSENLGADKVKERAVRLAAWSSDKDCNDHKIGVIQHVMGASCLVFMLPGCFAAYLAYAGVATHCTYLTLGLSVFLGYVAVLLP